MLTVVSCEAYADLDSVYLDDWIGVRRIQVAPYLNALSMLCLPLMIPTSLECVSNNLKHFDGRHGTCCVAYDM